MTAAIDLNWRQRGACKDADPEIFFDESKRGVKKAQAVCRRCPVLGTCLTWALEAGLPFGTAGGLSAGERDGLRRVAGRAA